MHGQIHCSNAFPGLEVESSGFEQVQSGLRKFDRQGIAIALCPGVDMGWPEADGFMVKEDTEPDEQQYGCNIGPVCSERVSHYFHLAKLGVVSG